MKLNNKVDINSNEVDFHDMDFDFQDYFNRYFKEDNVSLHSEEQRSEFDWRLIGFFCKSVFESNGDTGKIPFWVANHLAKKLYEMLGGVPWAQLVQTPYERPESIYTKLGERAMKIYCAVENGRNAGNDVTDQLASQASAQNVSYETARADYYKVKKCIEGKMGLPDKFLK